MKTSVAFLIFNRPDTTEQVFAAIRQAKPPKLLVVADGPRVERPGEAEKCEATREIIKRVDWDCELLTNYSDINLGCKQRVSSGLDWVFANVEEAIILEDDCLPHLTFFQFCEELLNKYKNDERILMISGTNMLKKWKIDRQSYHFSYYGGIWGWASWRRAWDHYDVEMKLWSEPEVRKRIRDVLCDLKQYYNREKAFDNVYSGKIDTWDYQWSFARLSQSGLSVVPSANLIANIGFSQEATHTINPFDKNANLSKHPMFFPLKEPLGVAVDREYDYNFYLRTKEPIDSKIKLFQLYNNLKKLFVRPQNN